jgi:hypothetical protein
MGSLPRKLPGWSQSGVRLAPRDAGSRNLFSASPRAQIIPPRMPRTIYALTVSKPRASGGSLECALARHLRGRAWRQRAGGARTASCRTPTRGTQCANSDAVARGQQVGRRQYIPRFSLYKMRTMSARGQFPRRREAAFFNPVRIQIFTFTMVHALMDLSAP